MSKFARRGKEPAGFEYLQPTLEVLENELRDRINEPHEGKRKVESIWPVHQLNWQRSRYVYDMHYKYHKIDRKVLDYCVRNKIVDGGLIAKWRKPGYERLCSTYVINTRNYNFGTVSICRVPPASLGEDQVVECPTTGCRGCASGGQRNIFGNKYGQSLAKIQMMREEREAREEREERQAAGDKRAREDDGDDDDAPPLPPGGDDFGGDDVVGRSKATIWAADDDDRAYDDDAPDSNKRARAE